MPRVCASADTARVPRSKPCQEISYTGLAPSLGASWQASIIRTSRVIRRSWHRTSLIDCQDRFTLSKWRPYLCLPLNDQSLTLSDCQSYRTITFIVVLREVVLPQSLTTTRPRPCREPHHHPLSIHNLLNESVAVASKHLS